MAKEEADSEGVAALSRLRREEKEEEDEQQQDCEEEGKEEKGPPHAQGLSPPGPT